MTRKQAGFRSPARGEDRTHLGHLMPVRSRDGNQDAKFPQDRGIIPFIKHLEENAEPRREAPQNLDLGRRPGLQLARQIGSGPLPGLLSRMRSRAALPSQCACSAGPGRSRPAAAAAAAGGSYRFALHPGSSFGAGDSFLRTLRGLRYRRTAVRRDHGVAQGAGRPGSPGGKEPPLPP